MTAARRSIDTMYPYQGADPVMVDDAAADAADAADAAARERADRDLDSAMYAREEVFAETGDAAHAWDVFREIRKLQRGGSR